MELREMAGFFGLEIVLAQQSQLIRRDQALTCGFTSAQISAAVRRGRWLRLLPAVYLVGAGRPTPEQRVRAVWLWAGEDSLIAGGAAAWWHGIASQPPAVIDVIVPLTRALRPPPGVRVIRSDVPARDRASGTASG